jgi:hypothetical protein
MASKSSWTKSTSPGRWLSWVRGVQGPTALCRKPIPQPFRAADRFTSSYDATAHCCGVTGRRCDATDHCCGVTGPSLRRNGSLLRCNGGPSLRRGGAHRCVGEGGLAAPRSSAHWLSLRFGAFQSYRGRPFCASSTRPAELPAKRASHRDDAMGRAAIGLTASFAALRPDEKSSPR